MVSEPTVLVVGAGGSIPYGYPSGQELVDQILDKLASVLPSHFSRTGVQRLLYDLGFKQQYIRKFCSELRFAQRESIDVFLEKRTEYKEIGKAMIAALLMPLEINDTLWTRRDWYHYLF